MVLFSTVLFSKNQPSQWSALDCLQQRRAVQEHVALSLHVTSTFDDSLQIALRERTTLQVVDGMLRGNRVIAWVFERNGARAGRGAMTWKMAEPGLLVGRWQTTFYSGTAVLARAPEVASAPDHGSDHD